MAACVAAVPAADSLLSAQTLVPALALVGVLCLGMWPLAARRSNDRILFRVLCLDILATGTVTALLPGTAIVERLSFLAGYLVATLVAAGSQRRASAFSGVVAGGLVLLLGAVFVIYHRVGGLDAWLLVARLGVLSAATVEVAWICAWTDAQTRRRAIGEQVERELKVRDLESAQVLSFTQALARSEGVGDVAEALLRHLRTHLELDVHALVLEADGEVQAIWEERGRLEATHVADRRGRLQEALATTGSRTSLARLEMRSLDGRDAPAKVELPTWVVVPLEVEGRHMGVLALGDRRRDGLPHQRIGLLADVARRTAEALQRIERSRGEENRRTGLLLRQMREGVLLLSPDGRALLANPAARDALESPGEDTALPDRIGDVALSELARTPPGVARRFRARLTRADGARPIELAGTAVGIVEGRKRVGTLVTLRDVTEEELARRRLVQAEKMTLVGQTLAGVAHELNNPLAALIGYADLLRHAVVPEALERPIQQMREQAVRATRIVRNLLNFARRRNPQRVAVQLSDLVYGTVELFAYEARMNEVTVDVDLGTGLPTLLADPHSLQQVLVNLVQNAIHALAAGSRRPRRMAISAHAAGEGLTLTVSDNGCGVPPGLRARLFEPFFTTKTEGHGTGLGLALSRAVAREHGGDLVLEPDTGEGATFTLRLPLRPVRAGRLVASLVAEGTDIPGSVLVVDDEASVRESLVAQIGHLGSRVESAGDANEAQRMLSLGTYDAVLLDVRMPGASGLDLHKILEARDPVLARRIVFMTGDFVNDDVLARLRQTGNPVLEKPFTVDELRSALRKAGTEAVAAGRPAVAPPARFITSTS